MKRFPGIRELHPTTKQLLSARALRSVGQGTLVVDFALYLHALQWSAVAIGLLLSASGIFGAALSLLVGTTSDRLRRKPFLLVYETIALLASLAALLTSQTAILATAAILGGYGRGATGAAGPFSPAEQAWLAEEVAPQRRGQVYSLNTALGFFGMGLGALIAVAPALWTSLLPGALAYRPLFIVVALSAIANLLLLSRAQENYHGSPKAETAQAKRSERQVRNQENHILLKLVSINAFNGIAVGLTGPLISYWFLLRYGVGPASIAPVMAVTFLVTGISSLLTGRLTQKIGIIRSVVWGRSVGLILLVILPLMPVYWLAGLVYLLRSAFNRGTAGARQALAVSLVRDQRRGLATSLNAVSFQIPQAAGPGLAGALLDAGQLALPFYVAAALQAVYLLLYQHAFREHEPPQDEQITDGEKSNTKDREKIQPRGSENKIWGAHD
jgi:predicted MFS family arabinose efflux permease